ncbi:hypothetical protein CROQUDRAFT_101137 [Cronartium quercuum f. sp. fusiforme G11]|uniref:Uncharacterized protein n=1 Tax=Cronartium quercuum f. sp. fusiforme G11 TaxID=708437 RepID=A0A9P6T5C5_9BASI|nr:hypothetical protein CROQUDRAFT_101137 [Cronartium quercuum f. sp. fusiforme G11]
MSTLTLTILRNIKPSKRCATQPSFRSLSVYTSPKADGPLKHIRVLDLSRILAGPFAAQMLGDMGAEVIKIEEPKKGDDTRWLKTENEQVNPVFNSNSSLSNYFVSCNRNKKSMTLNLKSPEGVEILKKLVKESDVLIENFIVGKMEELGLGYDTLHELNPKLVYSSLSGFGTTGPLAKAAGYDVIAAAKSGLMSITGEPDRSPMKIGVALSDLITGIYSAYGILVSLYNRDVNVGGSGQKVETSLLESSLSVLANVGSSYLNSNEEGKRWGTQHPAIVPYQAFETSDSYMIVGTTNNRQFHKLCDAINLPNLKTDPLFATNDKRVQNRSKLIEIISETLKSKPTSVWLTKLSDSGLPCSKVNTVKEGFDDEQSHTRGMIEEIRCEMSRLGKIKLIGVPIKLSETPGRIRTCPPELGQHTGEILSALGYPTNIQDQLRKAGII